MRWDSQVGLDLNFGPPRLEVSEPRVITKASPRITALFAQRRVRLFGTHWLVFYPGSWRLELADGMAVRDTSSVKRLDIAVARLRGEKLDGLTIDPQSGATTFFFDLGARIIARWPRGTIVDVDSELWSLHANRRYVSVYAGGRYVSGPTSQSTTATDSIGGSEPLVLARTERMRRKLLGTHNEAAA